jgi:hypothetical protein
VSGAGGEAGESASGAGGTPDSAAVGGGESGGAAGSSAGEGGDAGAGGASGSACGECAPGLSCVEQDSGAASCEYPNPGRWLVFTGNDSDGVTPPLELRAVRLEGPKHGTSISLSEGASGDYFEVDSWSPDGRQLIGFALSLETLGLNSLFHVEFGDGLPSTQAPLPGIPNSANVWSGAWASDSSRVFIQNFANAETYLVHFSSDGPRTRLLFQDTDALNLAFCTNPRWFVREITSQTGSTETRLVDSENPSQEKELWPGGVQTSPDAHFLIGSDDDTGIWRATCEADTEVVHLSARPAYDGFSWSDDSRFVAVAYDSEELEVLDAAKDFQTVFRAYTSGHNWAPKGSRLVVFGSSEPEAACEIIEADFAEMPVGVTRRGSCPEAKSWGILKNGAIWAELGEPDELEAFSVLEPGSIAWRPIATGMSDAYPNFSPDESFVVFDNRQEDGTTQTLAFSLREEVPKPVPLRPAPAAYVTLRNFYADGVLLSGGDTSDSRDDSQLWWAPLGASSLGPAVPLVDVAYADFPQLQPTP